MLALLLQCLRQGTEKVQGCLNSQLWVMSGTSCKGLEAWRQEMPGLGGKHKVQGILTEGAAPRGTHNHKELVGEGRMEDGLQHSNKFTCVAHGSTTRTLLFC